MKISQEVLKQRISSLVPSKNKSKISKDEENESNNRRRKNSNNKKIENVISIDSSDSNDNKISISITDDKPKRFSFSYPKTDNSNKTTKRLISKKKDSSDNKNNKNIITIDDSDSNNENDKNNKKESSSNTTSNTTLKEDNTMSNENNNINIAEIVISDDDNKINDTTSHVNSNNDNNDDSTSEYITINTNTSATNTPTTTATPISIKNGEKEEEHEEENYIGFESSDNSEEEEEEEENDKKKEEEEEDNKRKRKRNYEVHSRDILTPISIPPWIQPKKKYSEFAPEMLHEEIIDFVKYISPTPEEKYMREYALNRIKNVILDLWPGSVVEAYGSYKTNLYLPTSDVDIVILNEDLFVPSCFFDLQDALQEADVVSKIEVIDKARIPIIKLVEKVTGYHFDISANAESGINSANLMEKFIETTGYGEAIRALVLVIKQFLAQRYMNEVYSGGLGSYSVFILVTNFIMMHPLVQNKYIIPQENLGVLLLEFLELFGRVFNFEEVGLGISLKKGAFYFRKEDKNWFNYNRPRLLSLQDPDDENNDVGKNSFAVSKILQAFDQAFATVSGKMCAQFSRIQPDYKKELEHERQRHKKRKYSNSKHKRFNDDDDDDHDDDTFNFVEPYIRQCKSFLGSIIWINKETQLHRQRIKEVYEELHS